MLRATVSFARTLFLSLNVLISSIITSTAHTKYDGGLSSCPAYSAAVSHRRSLASSPVRVEDGAQFATVLAQKDAEQILIVSAVVDLSESGWSSSGSLLLTRNVMVMGDPSLSSYPTLRLNYVKNKIRLASGVSFTFKQLVLQGVRDESIARAAGFDLFAPTAPGGLSELILTDTVIVLPACFPDPYRASNHAAMSRPPGYPPGVQRVITLNQTGCLNSTAAPALQRCWPAAVLEEDFVSYGADVNEAGSPVPNNVNFVLRNTMMACGALVDVQCIEAHSPLACLLAMIRNVTATERGAGAALPDRADPAAGSTSSTPGAAAGRSVPTPEGGNGTPTTATVVGAVCGAVAGIFVALGVLLTFLVFHRRNRRPPRSSSTMGDFVRLGAADQGGTVGFEMVPPSPPASKCSNAAAKNADAVLRTSSHSESAVAELVQATDPGPQFVEFTTDGSSGACGEMIVSLWTPHRRDLRLGVRLQTKDSLDARDHAAFPSIDGGAGLHEHSTAVQRQQEQPAVVTLLDVTRGKGASGRVMEGMYGDQKVAVKVVEHWGRHPPWPRPPLPLLPALPLQLQPQQQPQQEQQPETAAGAAGMSESLIKAFAHEVEVLGRCEHPNVVRLLAACATPPRLCLVMELMETSLDKLMYGESVYGKKLPLPKVLHIALCVCRALAYLHPTVVHRDLKPANVLIDNASSDTPVVKLGDFGLSRLRMTVAPTTSPEAGTPPYMAPECFDVHNTVITHKADIFSFGVLLWELLAGMRPWAGCNIVAVALQVSMMGHRLPFTSIASSRCNANLQQLITSCWDTDPERRPAAAEVAKEIAGMLDACNRGTFRSFAMESQSCTVEVSV